MEFGKRNFVFIVSIVFFTVVSLEVVLNMLAATSFRVKLLLAPPWNPYGVARLVPDDRLGFRLNPKYPGHDRKGFNNPRVPDRAKIVVLGDSQSYPSNVEPYQAWPRQLESLTKKRVYSFAVPGYGPAHSLNLWAEAETLEPEIVIEGFYAGNDLFDSFDLVYNRGQLSELKSADIQIQRRVREAEALDPIAIRVLGMFSKETKNRVVRRKPSGTPPITETLLGFVSRYSHLYGLLRRIQYELLLNARKNPWDTAKAFAAAHPEYCQIFTTSQFRTIFTSEYRFIALNLEDPRIAEGHHISLKAILRMNELAERRNVRFIVALIPTKELVFEEVWSTPSESFRTLTNMETRFWKATKSVLEQQGITYVDLLPSLRSQLAKGIQPYQVSQDGHPNEHGHLAMANAIYALVQK